MIALTLTLIFGTVALYNAHLALDFFFGSGEAEVAPVRPIARRRRRIED